MDAGCVGEARGDFVVVGDRGDVVAVAGQVIEDDGYVPVAPSAPQLGEVEAAIGEVGGDRGAVPVEQDR
jgi:hypothetical protein